MRPGALPFAVFGLLLLPALAGCKDFPELDRATDPAVAAAPFPRLLPFEALVPPPPTPDPAPGLAEAAAALKARAAALQAAEP
jgi:hypothetical protein